MIFLSRIMTQNIIRRIMRMRRTVCVFAAAVLSVACNLSAQETSIYTEKDLVWKEDFNGKTVNKKDWNFETHEPGWVNNELQSYGTSKENTYVKDGFLVIQPVKQVKKDGSVSYTSGRINTRGKHAFTYGRIEARLKVPEGKGFLPAFWMMPDDESFYGQWPKCGEIDIMEVLGNQTDTLYGTLHFGEPHNQAQGTYKLTDGNFADSFHDFAVEWEPGEIRFYCDGVKYSTVNDWFTCRPGFEEVTYPAPFDQPFYIILNVAVGGDWPGNPDASTGFGKEAQMVVDWIKVYQKKEYNEDVEKPSAGPSTAKTDSSGNIIRGGEGDWELLKFQGGDAAFSASDGKLEIGPKSDGPVSYAIQVVQSPIVMEKGFSYRLSFDASSDEERTIITAITAPNNGWIRYLPDTDVKLEKNTRHFSWDFQMTEKTDSTARLEFNCGNQGSLSPVHISNVRLEKTGALDLALSGAKLLPDGNMIHNGQFQEGKGRLANWKIENTISAEVKVTNTNGRRELMVASGNTKADLKSVTVSQDGLYLSKGKQYTLRFDAYATKKCAMGVKLGEFTASPVLSKKSQKFEYTFSAENDSEQSLEMYLASQGTTIYVDNVSLKENICLLNGDFTSGMAAWELYAHQNSKSSCEIVETNGNKEAVISIDKTGNMDWMIQLKQSSITLEKGKTYRVSFRAKSDLDRTIMWALQRDGSKDDNWIPYSDTHRIEVSNDYKTYSHTFTMNNATDNAVIFTISMGAVNDKVINTSHKICIDDVSISVVK